LLHQMFNVSTLLLDDAFKTATPLTMASSVKRCDSLLYIYPSFTSLYLQKAWLTKQNVATVPQEIRKNHFLGILSCNWISFENMKLNFWEIGFFSVDLCLIKNTKLNNSVSIQFCKQIFVLMTAKKPE